MAMTPAPPANTTGWASSNTNVTQPSSGKKALGWVVNEKPASSYFNWLLQTIEGWLAWCLSLATGAVTWDYLHTFSAGLTVSNGTTATLAGNTILTSSGNLEIQTGSLLKLDAAVTYENAGLTGVGSVGGLPVLAASGGNHATATTGTSLASFTPANGFTVRVEAYLESSVSGEGVSISYKTPGGATRSYIVTLTQTGSGSGSLYPQFTSFVIAVGSGTVVNLTTTTSGTVTNAVGALTVIG
jgi:hypothetical protein